MPLNKAGKLRKHHQFIGIFPTKKGTFNHKSTNQPNPPEESKNSHFFLKKCDKIKNLRVQLNSMKRAR